MAGSIRCRADRTRRQEMKLYTGLLLAFFIALPNSYGADTLPLVYDPSTSDISPTTVSNACPVTVTSIADMRNNKESIGAEYRPILGKNSLEWVGSAIDNLKAYG